MKKSSNELNKSNVKAAVKQAGERRMLIAFILTVAAACCAGTLVNIGDFEALWNARKVALIAFGTLSVLNLVWLIIATAKHMNFRAKTLTPSFCFGSSLLLTVLSWLYMNTYIEIAPEMLIISVIAAGALYFIYSIFGCDFFMYSLLTMISIFALDSMRRNSGIVAVICMAVCIALSFIIVLALLLFKKSNGRLAFAGKMFQLPKNFKYYTFILTALSAFAGTIIALVLPSAMTFVVLGSAVLFLLIAVIYTIEAVYFS
jgi:hypothetical protein